MSEVKEDNKPIENDEKTRQEALKKLHQLYEEQEELQKANEQLEGQISSLLEEMDFDIGKDSGVHSNEKPRSL